MRFDSVMAEASITRIADARSLDRLSLSQAALSRSPAVSVRSLVFNALFYVNIIVRMIVALPTLALPRRFMLGILRRYTRAALSGCCGSSASVDVEWRGREKLPQGAYLVACKHQSLWETFALFMLLPDPTYILKRELMWIPLFGWLASKARMIPIDRGCARCGDGAHGGAGARGDPARASDRHLSRGHAASPGAEPRYLPGVAFLYDKMGLPCVPIALNSGLFWPRRTLHRYPGTVLVEVLDPIEPGLDKRAFLARLQAVLEEATARLVAEGQQSELSGTDACRPMPDFPPT